MLANIALHGIEKSLSKRGVYLVRYADDFLILCNEEKELLEAKLKIEAFLTGMGLELPKEKTTITYSVYSSPKKNSGIDFLGFNFVNYKVGIHKAAKDSHGNSTG
ncbi:reverse transcriptase domain-containing protein [Mucilaginibacter boryungensis]|uniref:reverse transcriptase domain-containing protein n=1 Tax=Mucilaginibacter boryungensis TaxID=768480 RepID=UPI00362D8719